MYMLTEDQPFANTLKLLKLFYVYPKSYKPSDVNKSKIIVTIIAVVWLQFIFGCLAHLIVTIKENTSDNISEDLAISISGLGTLTTVLRFHTNSKKWSKLLSRLTDLSTFGKPNKWDKTVKQLRPIPLFLFVYVGFGVAVYTFTSKLESSCEPDRNRHFICKTATPIWTPVALNDNLEECVFVLGIVTSFSVLTPAMLMYCLVFESTEMLICHIKSLQKNILHVYDDINEEIRLHKQSFCFDYHRHIISIGEDLCDLVKNTYGHLSLVAALVFGCILNQISSQYKVMGALLYLFGNLTTLVILCHSGQRIYNSSSSITETIYDSKWYEGNRRINKMLLFSIARSQKPLELKALPIGTFNYPLFRKILNTSFSYLTLLQNST